MNYQENNVTVSVPRVRNLSAYAEDHGLCPWTNAESVAESFPCSEANAPADSASGG